MSLLRYKLMMGFGDDGGEVLYDGGFNEDGLAAIHSDILNVGERIEAEFKFIHSIGEDPGAISIAYCHIGTKYQTQLSLHFSGWKGFQVRLANISGTDTSTKISSLTSIAAGSKLVFIIECIGSGTYQNCRLSIKVNGEEIYVYNNYSAKDNVALWVVDANTSYIGNVKVTRY